MTYLTVKSSFALIIFTALLTGCQSGRGEYNAVRTVGPGVAGGTQVAAADWRASSTVFLINVESDGSINPGCTANLIGRDLLLTAAHCALTGPQVDQPLKPGERRIVYFGRIVNQVAIQKLLDAGDYAGDSPLRIAYPSAVRAHPGWPGTMPNGKPFSDRLQNDVALIKLNQPAPSSAYPIELMKEAEIKILKSGARVSVAGFGTTATDAKSNVAQLSSLTTTINLYNEEIGEFVLRSVYQKFGSIPGDSGGGASVEVGEKHFLWGICHGTDSAGFSTYEPVLRHLSWIRETALVLGAALPLGI